MKSPWFLLLTMLSTGGALSAADSRGSHGAAGRKGNEKAHHISTHARKLIQDEAAFLRQKGINVVERVYGENQVVLMEPGAFNFIEQARIWSYPDGKVAIMRWQGGQAALTVWLGAPGTGRSSLQYKLLDPPFDWSEADQARKWLMVDEYGDRSMVDRNDPMTMIDYRESPEDLGASRLVHTDQGNVIELKADKTKRSRPFSGFPLSVGPNLVVHADEFRGGYLFAKLDPTQWVEFSGTLSGDEWNWIVPGQPIGEGQDKKDHMSLVRRKDLLSSARFAQELEDYDLLYLATNARNEKFFIDKTVPNLDTGPVSVVGKPQDLGAAISVFNGKKYVLVPKSNPLNHKVSSQAPLELDESWHWRSGGWRHKVGYLIEKGGYGMTPAFSGDPESYGKSWLLELHDSNEQRFALKAAVGTLSIPFVKILGSKEKQRSRFGVPRLDRQSQVAAEDPWVLVEQANGSRAWISTDTLDTRPAL